MSEYPRHRLTERERFSHYLRTGQILGDDAEGERAAAPPETKFNPYHDPDDGRFTFAPGGARSSGNGGAGGGRGGMPHAARRGSTTVMGRSISAPIPRARPADPASAGRQVDGGVTRQMPRTGQLPSALKPESPDRGTSAPIDTLLPSSGRGYRAYNRETNDQYATRTTVERIERLGEEWSKTGEAPFQVGDISHRGGGPFRPHSTHKSGREIDVRPFRNDRAMTPVSWQSSNYDRDTTLKFLNTVRKIYPNSIVLFNDPMAVSRKLSKPWKGHDNHIHIRFKDEL